MLHLERWVLICCLPVGNFLNPLLWDFKSHLIWSKGQNYKQRHKRRHNNKRCNAKHKCRHSGINDVVQCSFKIHIGVWTGYDIGFSHSVMWQQHLLCFADLNHHNCIKSPVKAVMLYIVIYMYNFFVCILTPCLMRPMRDWFAGSISTDNSSRQRCICVLSDTLHAPRLVWSHTVC